MRFPALAATNNFVSTSATGSCATSTTLKGFFEVESFAFGGEDAVSISTGGGRAGKINLDSFQIAKGFDSCSGVLVTEFLRGSTIPQVVLETRQSGGPSAAAQTVLTITLSNAVISSYTLNSGEDRPVEKIAFTFSKVTIVSSEPGSKPVTVIYDPASKSVVQ